MRRMKSLFFTVCLLMASIWWPALAQSVKVPPSTSVDAVIKNIPEIAQASIPLYHEDDAVRRLNTMFRLQGMAGRHSDALVTLDELTAIRAAADASSLPPMRAFLIAERSAALRDRDGRVPSHAVATAFHAVIDPLDDIQASKTFLWLSGDLPRMRNDLHAAAEKTIGKAELPLNDAIDLVRKQYLLQTFEVLAPNLKKLLAEDDARRYELQRDLMVATADGAQLAVQAIRPRNIGKRLPTLLIATIYADDSVASNNLRTMAAHGYSGAVMYSRGKGRSQQAPVPYEHESNDVRAVIEWIAKQSWSDGRVGMYGGSYNGFTQWAATKKLPKALKTIVPYVANNPGNGLPMENNIFIFANYAWPFYVTNSKGLDNTTYFDNSRWNALNERWYESGRSYRQIDAVDGAPNPWFQKWLRHPAYDTYWRSMTPFGKEFARIDIPVLTVTGYFDDGQQSALDYFKQHLRYKPDARHYLVIGPWDHGGAQAARKTSVLNGYTIEKVAQIDTEELTYQWMDHVFHGARLPALLGDRVNYQVMGANVWKHAPSLSAMADRRTVFHLLPAGGQERHRLVEDAKSPGGSVEQLVNFANRTESLGDHYPNPIVGKELDASSGLLYESAPLTRATEISGTFSGDLEVTVNKRDFDYSLTLYAVEPSGQLFHLSYIIGRASYADSMAKRKLLVPGKKTSLHFDRTRMTSRVLPAGSRLLLAVTVNKNAYAQLNHGSGKDVSDETIADAGVPMRVQWHATSRIEVPMRDTEERNP